MAKLRHFLQSIEPQKALIQRFNLMIRSLHNRVDCRTVRGVRQSLGGESYEMLTQETRDGNFKIVKEMDNQGHETQFHTLATKIEESI
jgi:hypothetical protein